MKDELLIKYLTGNCTEAEQQEVELWLDASDSHREQFDELTKVWKVTDVDQSFDSDLAWGKLSRRIKDSESSSSGLLRRLYPSRMAYMAAAAAVLLAVFFITKEIIMDTEVLKAANNEQVETLLSDGTKIAVNAGSKIKYPRSFKGTKRLVELEGEAYFDVERDLDKPFVVRTRKGEVEVLGTSFNLEENGDSLLLIVTEGMVALRPIYDTGTNKDQLFIAGQSGVLDYGSGKVFRSIETEADALFWYDKSLVFDGTPLPKVFEILERNYDVRFRYKSSDIDQCMLTTKFESERLADIIAVIETTFSIRIQPETNQYHVISDESQCTDS